MNINDYIESKAREGESAWFHKDEVKDMFKEYLSYSGEEQLEPKEEKTPLVISIRPED